MFTTALRYVMVLTVAAGSFVHLYAQDIAIPTVRAGLGPYRVNFTVIDRTHKPLFGATIQARLKYGLSGSRGKNLLVSTNSNGHARIEPLPARTRYPSLYLMFTYGADKETRQWTRGC